MRSESILVRERVLELAEEFYRAARYHVPRDWLQADLTMTQLKVLLTIFLDGPQTCSALADAVDLSLPTMTGILQRLAGRGYLERQPDQQDRRRNIAALTAEGQELVERLWTSGRDQLAALIDDIDLEGLRTVERALDILIKAVREQEGTEALDLPSVGAVS